MRLAQPGTTPVAGTLWLRLHRASARGGSRWSRLPNQRHCIGAPIVRPRGCRFHQPAKPTGPPEFPPYPSFEHRSIDQYPSRDGRVIEAKPAFRHHLLRIAVAQRISKISWATQHDNFFSEVSATEHHRSRFRHRPLPYQTGIPLRKNRIKNLVMAALRRALLGVGLPAWPAGSEKPAGPAVRWG